MDYRIEYCRYSARDGSRKRTDHINGFDTMEAALSIARATCRAWHETDPDHTYSVHAISLVGCRYDEEEASIGWETSAEWTARTAEKKG